MEEWTCSARSYRFERQVADAFREEVHWVCRLSAYDSFFSLMTVLVFDFWFFLMAFPVFFLIFQFIFSSFLVHVTHNRFPCKHFFLCWYPRFNHHNDRQF